MDKMELINYIRITQILVEDGWKLIDNGYPKIEMAINEKLNEKIIFESENDFLQWFKEFHTRLL